MDTAAPPPFPQYSWLAFRIASEAKPALFTNHLESQCHMISLTARGTHFVRWISRGREKQWQAHTGLVNFTPRDGEQHTFLLQREPFLDMPVFLIPDAHLRECLKTDHCAATVELRHHLFRHDAALQSYLRRLAITRPVAAAGSGLRNEETARQLLLRLVGLCGGGRPEWHRDTNAFARQTMADLVDYIDAHLHHETSLSEMAALVRLSPSHFAKKFRQSTGVSLYRFVNLRRVNRALHSLKGNTGSLLTISHDLGFSSQSHFTLLFRSLTGMTPAKYRRNFKRTVG